MHEVSLVSALVDQIQEIGLKEQFDRVIEIRLEVGRLSGVDPSCLEFCYSEVTRGSVLDGSKLTLVETDGEAFRVLDIEVP